MSVTVICLSCVIIDDGSVILGLEPCKQTEKSGHKLHLIDKLDSSQS